MYHTHIWSTLQRDMRQRTKGNRLYGWIDRQGARKCVTHLLPNDIGNDATIAPPPHIGSRCREEEEKVERGDTAAAVVSVAAAAVAASVAAAAAVVSEKERNNNCAGSREQSGTKWIVIGAWSTAIQIERG